MTTTTSLAPQPILDVVPTFVSARAADVILSDVRPTSITPDALRAINILLDELLWLILASARSFDTSRLKSGISKTIPTQLGKDAILEAEIEIRAYRDKTKTKRPRTARPSEEVLDAFPLQEAFDFLRRKCQVLSSFGELEEDVALEGRLLEKYRTASSLLPTNDFIEPAPLYITAVVEHVCQHVLSNVARVVARDSSRTTADLAILYTSLCEDSLIYPIFKNMKVFGHIQNRMKPNTTRKKSISIKPPEGNNYGRGGTESPTSSSFFSVPSSPSWSKRPPPPPPDALAYSRGGPVSGPRPSADSSDVSSVPGDIIVGAPPSSGKRSGEKSRMMKMFRGGGGGGGGGAGAAGGSDYSAAEETRPHQRSNSISSSGEGRRLNLNGPTTSSSSADLSSSSVANREHMVDSIDDGSIHQFEELLDSGSTMKVSLTPDRLKTFEVFSKEKNLRMNRSAAAVVAAQGTMTAVPTNDPSHLNLSLSSSSSDLNALNNQKPKSGMIPRTPVRETFIEEDDEPIDGTTVTGGPGSSLLLPLPNGGPLGVGRQRTQSLAEFLKETGPPLSSSSTTPVTTTTTTTTVPSSSSFLLATAATIVPKGGSVPFSKDWNDHYDNRNKPPLVTTTDNQSFQPTGTADSNNNNNNNNNNMSSLMLPPVVPRQRATTMDPASIKAHNERSSNSNSSGGGGTARMNTNGTVRQAQGQLPSLPPSNTFPSSYKTQRKTTGGPSRNRESLDLDDIMNGDDDDEQDEDEDEDGGEKDVAAIAHAVAPVPPSSYVPTTMTTTTTTTTTTTATRTNGVAAIGSAKPATTHVSASAREFMQFLEQGPPDDEYAGSMMNSSISNFSQIGSANQKGGRFAKMVNKLRRGTPSTEKLGRTRSIDPFSDNSVSRIPSTQSGSPHRSPPTSASLPRHRSARDLTSVARNVQPPLPLGWTPPVPPPPPTPPQPEPLRTIPVSSSPDQTSTTLPPTYPPGIVPDAIATSAPRPTEPTSSHSTPVSIQSRSTPTAITQKPPTPRKDSYRRKPVPTEILLQPEVPVPELPAHVSNKAPHSHSQSHSLTISTEGAIAEEPLPTADSFPPVPQTLSPIRSPKSESVDSPSSLKKPDVEVPIAPVVEDVLPVEQDVPPRAASEPQTPASPTRSKSLEEPTSLTLDRDTSVEAIETTLHDEAAPVTKAQTENSVSGMGDSWLEKAAELRKILRLAQHVEESRLLVDMFLIQCGMTIPDDDEEEEGEEEVDVAGASVEASGTTMVEDHSVLEVLLGDGPIDPSLTAGLPASVIDSLAQVTAPIPQNESHQ